MGLSVKTYHVAIYLRLSREEHSSSCEINNNFAELESSSICSQKEMIDSYIEKQDNMKVYDVYVDYGYSGTNFERPELLRMIRDIKIGNVNCVIVKDLSRLGRDYIEVGRLIQKTFPTFFVRFIALTDHFDSLRANGNESSLIIPMKNFINDSYARDISEKVRSHQKIKRENGDFIGAFAVYGYRKCNYNRNQLVIDAYAAIVIRKIFRWKIEGYSNLAIAKRLEDFGIFSPMEYKKLQGENFQTGFFTRSITKWSAVAVKRILTDETYIGTLVQGKEEKINYKLKKSKRKPKEAWTRVPQAHTAIIAKEEFELVQDLLHTETRSQNGVKNSSIYTGILFCADCKRPMTRRISRYKGKEKIFFICSSNNKKGICSRHTISEAHLQMIILAEIHKQLDIFLNKKKILKSTERITIDKKELLILKKEMQTLQKEQEIYKCLSYRLCEDFRKHLLTEKEKDIFQEIYEERFQNLEEAIKKQQEALKKMTASISSTEQYLEQQKTNAQFLNLDRILFVSFIKRIFVYENNKIEIEFRYHLKENGVQI